MSKEINSSVVRVQQGLRAGLELAAHVCVVSCLDYSRRALQAGEEALGTKRSRAGHV